MGGLLGYIGICLLSYHFFVLVHHLIVIMLDGQVVNVVVVVCSDCKLSCY